MSTYVRREAQKGALSDMVLSYLFRDLLPEIPEYFPRVWKRASVLHEIHAVALHIFGRSPLFPNGRYLHTVRMATTNGMKDWEAKLQMQKFIQTVFNLKVCR